MWRPLWFLPPKQRYFSLPGKGCMQINPFNWDFLQLNITASNWREDETVKETDLRFTIRYVQLKRRRDREGDRSKIYNLLWAIHELLWALFAATVNIVDAAEIVAGVRFPPMSRLKRLIPASVDVKNWAIWSWAQVLNEIAVESCEAWRSAISAGEEFRGDQRFIGTWSRSIFFSILHIVGGVAWAGVVYFFFLSAW